MGGLLFHSDLVGRSVGETDPGGRRRRVCEANKQIKVLALHWQQIIITNSPTGGALFEYQSGVRDGQVEDTILLLDTNWLSGQRWSWSRQTSDCNLTIVDDQAG